MKDAGIILIVFFPIDAIQVINTDSLGTILAFVNPMSVSRFSDLCVNNELISLGVIQMFSLFSLVQYSFFDVEGVLPVNIFPSSISFRCFQALMY